MTQTIGNTAADDTKLRGDIDTEKSLGIVTKLNSELARNIPRDQKAELRELLELVAKAAGIEDAKIRSAQIEWIENHFPIEDMALSRRDLEQVEHEHALPGTPVELQAKLGTASQVALQDITRWKRFAQTTLVKTLHRMEERGDTPEEEMDALLRALRPVQERLRPAAATLMLAASARMAEQLDQNDGYYKTRGALANLLARLKDVPSRRRRAFLYWEILHELQALDAERIAGGAWASLVNTDANNLAVVLDDLGEAEQSVRWMKLAVAAGSAARRLGEDDAAEAHFGLAAFLGDSSVTPEWAALLGDMGNVPGAWKTPFAWENATDLDMWLVEMGAAVAHCNVGDKNDRPRKVTGALFNAGVTVSRGAKSGGQWRNAVECRIVLNGAGLLWALSSREGNHQEDFIAAMKVYKGSNCAVNLMGTLVSLDTKSGTDEILARFASALHWLKPAIPAGDWTRIENSINRLNFTPKTDEDNPIAALAAIVVASLPEGSWKMAWETFVETPKPETLGTLLAQTAEAGHAGYLAGMKRLVAKLAEFEDVGRRWPDGFMEMTIEAPPGHAEIEAEYQRMLDDGVSFSDRLAKIANELIHG